MSHSSYTALVVIIAALPVFSSTTVAAAGTDYKNPMKLDLELLDDKVIPGAKDAPTQHDYYESEEVRKWAESYHMKPGIKRMNERNFTSAFSEFDFVLRYLPNHPRALSLMGDLTILMKRPDIGDAYFKKAFELYPKTVRAESHKDYGRFLYLAGKHEEAIKVLKESLEMDPKLSLAHYYLGLSYHAVKDYAKAMHHARIIYSRGFPLSELRQKLIAANVWDPNDTGPDGTRPGNPDAHENLRGQ